LALRGEEDFGRLVCQGSCEERENQSTLHFSSLGQQEYDLFIKDHNKRLHSNENKYMEI